MQQSSPTNPNRTARQDLPGYSSVELKELSGFKPRATAELQANLILESLSSARQ